MSDKNRIFLGNIKAYTPQKGVDYWTEEDKAEINEYVDSKYQTPDYNQNDSAQPDYIKNRPFYTEVKEVNYFEAFIETENIGNPWFLDKKIGLVEGVTYDVDFVDIEGTILNSFTLTATTEYGGVMIWNSDPAFSITDGIVDTNLTPGDMTMIYVVNSPDVRYVRIHGFSSTQVIYHKVPQEYLTKPDYKQNDSTHPAYIENRPFYTEVKEADLGTIMFTDIDRGYMQLDRKIGLIEGWTYTVELIDEDGTIVDNFTEIALNDGYGVICIVNDNTSIKIFDGQDVDWNVTDNTCVIEFPIGMTIEKMRIKGSITVHHKIAQEYLDLSEAERLHYYGDSSIIPSDSSLFTFALSDTTMTATITLTDEAKADTSLTDIVIPYKYTVGDKEFIVKSIGSYAFDECANLSSIVIPNSITSIGVASFRDCTSLTNIILPDSLTAISANAFYNCTSLSSITIPDGITKILPYTFRYCTNLLNIILPDSITIINTYAFSDCTSLSSITIPKNVKLINNGLFQNCTILENVEIPSGVTRITGNAFAGCECLTTVTIPPSVTTIGSASTLFANVDISGLTIKCAAGSYAETYAKENNIAIEYTEEVTKTYVDGKIGDDLNERLTTVDESINTINETLVNKVNKQVDTTYEGMFLKAINGVATWSPVYIAEEVNF